MSHEVPSWTTSWLDFCWVCNFSQYVMLLVGVANAFGKYALGKTAAFVFGVDGLGDMTFLTEDMRFHYWAAMWGITVGPLAAAAVALGNALLFHDLPNM